MTDITHTPPAPLILRAFLLKAIADPRVQVGIAAVIYAILTCVILAANPGWALRFRIDLSPVLTAAPELKVHIFSALSAFGIGVALMLGVKGRTTHKVLGYAWVIAMLSTAISSFFLFGGVPDHVSLIHALSAWTLIGLPAGVFAARRKKIKLHAKRMTGMFVGGMLIAGLFTFLPGRTMFSIFFGA